jgi:hypothetical protein
MNLTIDSALHGVRELLRDQIGPAVGDAYAAQMTRLAGRLMNICANWVDDAAVLRVEENAEIRAVLGDAAGNVDSALAAALTEAARSCDPGLRISELDRENHRLRTLLVSTQTQLELQQGTAARAMDQRIWRLLEATEERRAPRE